MEESLWSGFLQENWGKVFQLRMVVLWHQVVGDHGRPSGEPQKVMAEEPTGDAASCHTSYAENEVWGNGNRTFSGFGAEACGKFLSN